MTGPESRRPAALEAELERHLEIVVAARDLLPAVGAAADAVIAAFEAGGRLFALGNGGSAADAQHLAAELAGRFRREREPLPAASLTTDPSVMTAIGNDYSFDDAFARQVRAHVQRGDVVVAFTTSGESENVVRALEAARERGATTLLFAGRDGGRARRLADHAIVVPVEDTARIQEVHLLFLHLLSERVDAWAVGRRGRPRR
ncbi:MAG TPA: SIS domain-containing protein [Candidatus Limnocylindrales bacterium]|nr:SIS domain-containing protein [Candidatus Limnocylindrales bacterium]